MGLPSLRHILAALLVLLFLATGAAAAVVRMTPATASGTVGSTLVVTVEADAVTDLGGFQFGFVYNTDDLQALSVTINPAFDNVVAQDLGTLSGSGMVAATVYDNPSLAGTPLTLATIEFKILTPVTAAISLDRVILGAVGGISIPASASGGSIVGNQTYVVTFDLDGGSRTGGGELTQTITHGQAATAPLFTAPVGKTFSDWSTTIASITSDLTVTAQYAINSYTLTYSAGANGTLLGTTSQNVDHGSSGSSVTAEPVEGYHFVKWSDDSTANPRTDSGVTSHLTVSATFADLTKPVISNTAPGQDSFINTGSVGYTLSEAVVSGSITFTQAGGADDSSSPRGYALSAPDMTAGSHTIGGISLQSGTIYTITFNASDAADNAAIPVIITNVTYDATAPVVTIATPAPGVLTKSVAVTYSLSKQLGTATITATRTGGTADGASYSYPLSADELANGSHTVDTGFTLVNGATYTFTVSDIVDLVGNSAGDVSVAGITFDDTALPVALTAPATASTLTATQVDITLGEDAQTSNITFTRTGGVEDSGSPHIYTVTGVDLFFGSHAIITGLPLVNGTIYSVSLAATDLAGNPATTATVTNVTFIDRYTLTAEKTGTGTGTVTAPADFGSGISCGTSCSEIYTPGATVTLTATANPDSRFSSWSGCDSTSGTGNSLCTIAVNSDKTVSASFAINSYTINSYTLTYSAGTNGTLSGTASESVNHGSSGSAVMAVPANGYHFVQWSDGSTVNPRTDSSVTGNITVSASFAINSYTVTFDLAGGSRTGGGELTQTITHGQSATAPLFDSPVGKTFSGWSTPFSNITAVTTVTAQYPLGTPIVTGDAFTNNKRPTWSWLTGKNGNGTFRYHQDIDDFTGSYTTTTNLSVTALTDLSDGPHTLYVQERNDAGNWSMSGSFTTVVDTINPILIVSTLDNQTTNNATLNISGTVNEISSVTINDIPTTVTNGLFSYPVTLEGGSNTITIVATDSVGNSTTTIRTVIFDLDAPALTITTPADNSATATTQTTITGSCGDAVNVSVKVNNNTQQSAIITSGSYSLTVNLSEGQNTLTVTATDTIGNSTSTARTVLYDATAPTLAITTPAADITTHSMPYTISGTVDDALTDVSLTMAVNGQAVAPTINGADFTYQLDALQGGTYQFVVTAKDQLENTATVMRNVIYAPNGDINNDGVTTAADALLALQMAVGMRAIARDADVAPLVNGVPNPDGKVTAADALVILRKAVRLW